jgi:ABC-2 type transport system ATP-binding protein
VDLAIQTEHLTKIYAGRVIAVNDLNLAVPRGSVYGLLGPNGAGKTTTLRLLLGLQRPTAGRAEVFGHACGVNATQVRQMIGFLPTHPSLPGNLLAIEYLDLLGRIYRIPAEVRRPRLSSLLRAVGLLGATEQRIQTFSTGMRTRLGIAASLLADPPLLIWDEPTAGLDPAARRFTLDLIRDLAKTRTVMVATHILSDIDQICDHVGVMLEGRMIFSGTMNDMKRRLHQDDFIVELDATAEAVKTLVAETPNLQGIALSVRNSNSLAVKVLDGRSRARAVADLMGLLDNRSLALRAIRSGYNETEDAYLQLLQEDHAHGFRRFDFQSLTGTDARSGDLST